MAVGVVRATYGAGYAHQGTPQPAAEESSLEFFSATQNMQEVNEGKVLGITMIPKEGNMSYGMVAQYAEKSTKEDPIICVTSNYGGRVEKYYVHVNDVDPADATQLEMFAFLSYADDQGLTDAGSFGSYHYLKLYARNAEENGYAMQVSGYGNFLQEKQNWKEIIKRMKEDYFGAKLYGQVRRCESLIGAMEAPICKKTVSNDTKEAAIALKKSAAAEREEQIAFISAYIEEQLEKWRKGEIKELSFQIGANLFTEKEWDTLLEKFDSVMESIRESMKQELERRKAEEQREKERLEQEAKRKAIQKQMERREAAGLLFELPLPTECGLLLAETIVCTCPSVSPEQPAPRYIICYTEEGITCKGMDSADGEEWLIPFQDAEQYQKVIEFLKSFPPDENLPFAARKDFWEDFLIS